MIVDGRNGFSKMFGAEVDVATLKYAIVLDEDTELTAGSGLALRGAIAHPINRPKIVDGRLVSGFTVMVPGIASSGTSLKRWRLPGYFSPFASGSRSVHLYADREFSGKEVWRFTPPGARG